MLKGNRGRVDLGERSGWGGDWEEWSEGGCSWDAIREGRINVFKVQINSAILLRKKTDI